MGSSPEGSPGKLIVDSLHGDIHLYPREWAILDTPAFQRLRRIKQLQMSQVTYPNATHTRFAHSLGTLAIMSRILTVARGNPCVRPNKRQSENLRMAALLHDVGHYPYSHLMEGIDGIVLTEDAVQDGSPGGGPIDASKKPIAYPDHEEVGAHIVTHRRDLIDAIGGRARAREVADLFGKARPGSAQWSKLLHSSFDMDRLDYLRRDAYATGVPYGDTDVNYLLNSLRVSDSGFVGVDDKALPAAEHFLLARFFMHKTVYFHKTTFGIEEACRQLLRRVRNDGLFGIPSDGSQILNLVGSERLPDFNDDFVDRIVHQAAQQGDPVVKALARCIESRRPPKLLKEVQILEDVARSSGHNGGTFFWAKARTSLRDLATKYGIPLGQFLLCRTKPLKLEPHGPLVSVQQARKLPSEDEDEVIRVFVGNETEPRSLVSINHSLIYACGSHTWQAFRLYVVYEGSDRADVVSRLQADVANWDATT